MINCSKVYYIGLCQTFKHILYVQHEKNLLSGRSDFSPASIMRHRLSVWNSWGLLQYLLFSHSQCPVSLFSVFLLCLYFIQLIIMDLQAFSVCFCAYTKCVSVLDELVYQLPNEKYTPCHSCDCFARVFRQGSLSHKHFFTFSFF